MKMTSVNKAQFASLNDKRYHFLDGIVSLPYGHPLLSKIYQTKKAYPKIHVVSEQEKRNLLKLENEAVAKYKRLPLEETHLDAVRGLIEPRSFPVHQ